MHRILIVLNITYFLWIWGKCDQYMSLAFTWTIFFTLKNKWKVTCQALWFHKEPLLSHKMFLIVDNNNNVRDATLKNIWLKCSLGSRNGPTVSKSLFLRVSQCSIFSGETVFAHLDRNESWFLLNVSLMGCCVFGDAHQLCCHAAQIDMNI